MAIERVDILPELEGFWMMPRGSETEVLVAAWMLQTTVAKLMASESGPHRRGKMRELYVNTGRAMRWADSLQSYLLEITRRKTWCAT